MVGMITTDQSGMKDLESLPHLESHHIADLKRSGLSDETIAEAGVFSVSSDEVRNILGFNPNNSPGLAFPYNLLIVFL